MRFDRRKFLAVAAVTPLSPLLPSASPDDPSAPSATFLRTVAGKATPAGGAEGLAPPVPDPKPGQVHQVTSASELGAALGNVTPGDQIVVAPGSYAGNFVCARSGAKGDEIVIRAGTLTGGGVTDHILGASLGSIGATGADVIWRGFTIKANNASMGARSRFNRCQMSGGDSWYVSKGQDNWVDWCSALDCTRGFRVSGGPSHATGTTLYRFYSDRQKRQGPRVQISQIAVGKGNGDLPRDFGAHVFECYLGPPGNWSQAFHIKGSNVTVERVTSKGGRLCIRHGTHNTFLANTVEGPGLIQIDSLANVAADNVGTLWLLSGNAGPTTTGGGVYPAARQCRIIRQKGTVVVGPTLGWTPSQPPDASDTIEECSTVQIKAGKPSRVAASAYPAQRPARALAIGEVGPTGKYTAF